MNKKAQGWMGENAGKLILMLAIIIVLVLIPVKIKEGSTQAFTKASCTTKVLLNAGVRVPLARTELVTADCPTKLVYIHLDKIITESSDGGKFPEIKIGCGGSWLTGGATTSAGVEKLSPSNSDEDKAKCFFNKVNEQLSQIMYSCWDQFGRGYLDVYGGTERNCVICARIEFMDDVKKFMDENGIDAHSLEDGSGKKSYVLDEYMRNHHHALTPSISYYEFLLDVGEDAFKLPYYDYSVDEVYAVVFKNEYPPDVKAWLKSGWRIVTCGKDLVFGSGEDVCADLKNEVKEKIKDTPKGINMNSFLRYSEVKDECDVLK